jgi:hypothetical protein
MTRVLPLPFPSFLLTLISLTLPFPVPSNAATSPLCLAPHDKTKSNGWRSEKAEDREGSEAKSCHSFARQGMRITLLQETDEEA